MSLKHFHMIFLFFAILFDGGFWLWTLMAPEQAEKLGAQGIGMVAGWTSLLLLGYGIWYLVRKSRSIIV
jgi:hypothetical protein